MPSVRGALILLPSDLMGGAERILRMVAAQAATSGRFSQVDICVLCWARTGTLDELEAQPNVSLRYFHARNLIHALPFCLGILRRHRYELVLSSNTYINAVCSILRKLRWLKADTLISRESTIIFDRNFGWKGRAIRALYRLYGNQDLIVCQTERMRRSVDENTAGRLNDKLKVISNPVDVAAIRAVAAAPLPAAVSQRLQARPHIVWCGRMIDVKNPMLAIDTLARLRGQFGLIMIGDGPLLPAVQDYASSLSLSEDVIFTGKLDNPFPYMAAAAKGLLTSRKEGFPNVVNEMLACGIGQVVVTDCAGDLDRYRCVHITPHDADALARALGVPTGEDLPARRDHDRREFLRTADVFLDAMLDRARVAAEAVAR
ncbi:glycosyltransferase [Aestuariivirga sp. YIM B02566]